MSAAQVHAHLKEKAKQRLVIILIYLLFSPVSFMVFYMNSLCLLPVRQIWRHFILHHHPPLPCQVRRPPPYSSQIFIRCNCRYKIVHVIDKNVKFVWEIKLRMKYLINRLIHTGASQDSYCNLNSGFSSPTRFSSVDKIF